MREFTDISRAFSCLLQKRNIMLRSFVFLVCCLCVAFCLVIGGNLNVGWLVATPDRMVRHRHKHLLLKTHNQPTHTLPLCPCWKFCSRNTNYSPQWNTWPKLCHKNLIRNRLTKLNIKKNIYIKNTGNTNTNYRCRIWPGFNERGEGKEGGKGE